MTLRDVLAITGLSTIGCDVINKLEESETTWTLTLNVAPSSYTHLFDDVSTAKKLSLEEEHKYFLWSFLDRFIFCPVGVKPIMDLCLIMAAMATGYKFCAAQILLGNYN